MENPKKTTGSSSASKALIYLRSAVADEGSINRQEEACLHLLTQSNHIHTASIEDNGCSGIGWMTRPGLARALEMCEEGVIDVLVCTRLDRLSRDAGELLELVAHLKHAGIRLETVEEGDVFAQPEILHRYETLALYFQSTATPTRTSRRRKRSKSQQGQTYPATQTNLPLFEE